MEMALLENYAISPSNQPDDSTLHMRKVAAGSEAA